MTMIKEYGSHQIGFGLSWHLSSKGALKRDIKSEAEKLGMTFAVSREIKFDDKEVIQFSLIDMPEYEGARAAAEMVASLKENAIYLYAISEEKIWVCIINNGEVISGGDVLINKEDFVGEFEELIESTGVDTDRFEFYADSNMAEIELGDAVGSRVDTYIDFLELTQSVDFSEVPAFEKLHGDTQKKIFLGLGTAVLIGLGYWGISSIDFSQFEEKEPVINIEEIRKKLPNGIERDKGDFVNQKVGPSRSEIIETAYKEEVSWVNSDINLYDNKKLLDGIANYISSQSRFEGGWEANTYIFDYSQKDFHEVVWEKLQYGTALIFKQKMGDRLAVKFGDKGQTASVFDPVVHTKPDHEKDVQTIMSSDPLVLANFMHSLDRANIQWVTAKIPVDVRPVPIEGINNAAEARKRQFQYESRNFTITGHGLYELKKMSKVIDGFDRFMVERVKFEFDNNFKWIVYGVFYEQEIR